MIQVFQYENSPIQFDVIEGVVKANATVMAKPFGKRPDDIFKTQQWIDFENAVIEDTGLNYEDIRSLKEGANGGSWIHQELVIEFARRLNPKFALWCNRKIAELLRSGKTEIAPLSSDEIIKQAFNILNSENYQLKVENKDLKQKEEYHAPMIETYHKVMDSGKAIDFEEAAKSFNLKSRTVLIDKLKSMALITSRSLPAGRMIDSGYMIVKQVPIMGGRNIVCQTFITMKGLEYIGKKLNLIPVTLSLPLYSRM